MEVVLALTFTLQLTLQTFAFNSSFNQNLALWDCTQLEIADRAFQDNVEFNQDLSGWSVPRLRSAVSMFEGATSFNQNLCGWTVTLDRSHPFRGKDMFVDTGCPDSQSPDGPWQGPFCETCRKGLTQEEDQWYATLLEGVLQ